MHRNTFIDSPRVLNSDMSAKCNSNLFFAGQITGVEGYVESASSGIMAGYNLACEILGEELPVLNTKTVTGALAPYISNESNTSFQPMNANFGIVAPLGYRVKGGKVAKYEVVAARALEEIESIKKNIKI